MEFEKIKKVNDAMTLTDIKGKKYAEVSQRIKAFREVCPNGTIQTEWVKLEDDVCICKASIFDEEGRMLGNAHAMERFSQKGINSTSMLENCETSAIGRAIAFATSLGCSNIASVEEVANAEMKKVEYEKQMSLQGKAWAMNRTELNRLGYDFRSEDIDSWICEKARVPSQDVQDLNLEQLIRLNKTYSVVIRAKGGNTLND